MKYSYLFVLLLFMNFGCVQSKSKHITEFSQNDLKNGILVDVRTPEEYESGHLDNALNINWFDENFPSQFKSFPKNTTIYVYCKKGGRSSKAQKRLLTLGFTNVIDLEGGYDEWLDFEK